MFYCSQNMSQVFNALTSNVKWGPSEILTFFPYLVSLWTWWFWKGEWQSKKFSTRRERWRTLSLSIFFGVSVGSGEREGAEEGVHSDPLMWCTDGDILCL